MLSVLMMSIIMQSVVMLSVIAPARGFVTVSHFHIFTKTVAYSSGTHLRDVNLRSGSLPYPQILD